MPRTRIRVKRSLQLPPSMLSILPKKNLFYDDSLGAIEIVRNRTSTAAQQGYDAYIFSRDVVCFMYLRTRPSRDPPSARQLSSHTRKWHRVESSLRKSGWRYRRLPSFDVKLCNLKPRLCSPSPTRSENRDSSALAESRWPILQEFDQRTSENG